MTTLTEKERLDLLDALAEWNDLIGPKELESNENGFTSESYSQMVEKLKGIEL